MKKKQNKITLKKLSIARINRYGMTKIVGGEINFKTSRPTIEDVSTEFQDSNIHCNDGNTP